MHLHLSKHSVALICKSSRETTSLLIQRAWNGVHSSFANSCLTSDVHSSSGMALRIVLLLALFAAAASQQAESYASEPALISSSPLSKLAFGSCSKHVLPAPMWKLLHSHHPEGVSSQCICTNVSVFRRASAFVWLGDVVYADTRLRPFVWTPSNLTTMAHKYELQRGNKDYADSTASTRVVGVWDDHDYVRTQLLTRPAVLQAFLHRETTTEALSTRTRTRARSFS